MTKIYSQEDGNLNTKPIITSRKNVYKDIDLSFAKRPSGDVYKKTDAAAVKQAVRNLILTSDFEKPFNPYFGGNINSALFELFEDYDEDIVRDRITTAITNFEPRARIRKISIRPNPDYNVFKISIVFQVVSTSTLEELNLTLTRLR